jgi:hypothetical protein
MKPVLATHSIPVRFVPDLNFRRAVEPVPSMTGIINLKNIRIEKHSTIVFEGALSIPTVLIEENRSF